MIDLSKFSFSTIYSIDVDSRPMQGETLEDLTPPNYSKLSWKCTEREASELGYNKSWSPGRHRKHCAILSFLDFCDFIEHAGLWVKKVQTMGSIGAPGFGGSLVPAVAFGDDDNLSSVLSCYVTPVPAEDMLPDPQQPWLFEPPPLDFDAIELEMWSWFECGACEARKRVAECRLKLGLPLARILV